MSALRLGTRGSDLARTQSGHVADAIRAATGLEVELVIITTRGDQIRDRPLQQVGGKGLFTKEIEDAMLAGEVDLAVHSMKDMPTEGPRGLVIAAVPPRVDPRDVLVGARLDELPEGARVGTGSVRRAMQLRALRPDLDIQGIRGNVGTRIDRQRAGDYDAVMLAAAGMKRLGRIDEASDLLDPKVFVPAVGQGALAVQCRSKDPRTLEALEAIHDETTGIRVAAERAFLEEVSGGCSAPAACYCWFEEETIVATAVWASSEGEPGRRLTLRSDPLHAHPLGRDLARRLKAGEGTPLRPGPG